MLDRIPDFQANPSIHFNLLKAHSISRVVTVARDVVTGIDNNSTKRRFLQQIALLLPGPYMGLKVGNQPDQNSRVAENRLGESVCSRRLKQDLRIRQMDAAPPYREP